MSRLNWSRRPPQWTPRYTPKPTTAIARQAAIVAQLYEDLERKHSPKSHASKLRRLNYAKDKLNALYRAQKHRIPESTPTK